MTDQTAEAARQPVTPVERMLDRMRILPGIFGRIARRKLRRRIGRRAVAYFDDCVARLGPGDICLDIGANIGDYTEMLANTGADVHAFEPDPEVFSWLQKRFADRSNVILHHAAVHVASGRVTLRRAADFDSDPVWRSQASSIVFNDPKKFLQDGFEVECRALSDVLTSFDRPCALVKVDIEGAEFDLLEQIFAHPADYPFEKMFVETHVRYDLSKTGLIDRLQDSAPDLPGRYVNLYWR